MAQHSIFLINITKDIMVSKWPPSSAQLCTRPTKQRTATQIYRLSRCFNHLIDKEVLAVPEFGNNEETVTYQVTCWSLGLEDRIC